MANLGGVDSDEGDRSSSATGAICASLIDEAVASGELEFELEVHSKYFAPGVFAADLCHPGEVNLWPGSMFGVNGLDPRQLTKAEIVTREPRPETGRLPQAQRAGLRAGMARVHGRPDRRARDAADRRRLLTDAARGARRERAPTSWPSPTPGGACASPTGRWCPRDGRRAPRRRPLHVGAAGRHGPAAPDPGLPGHRPGRRRRRPPWRSPTASHRGTSTSRGLQSALSDQGVVLGAEEPAGRPRLTAAPARAMGAGVAFGRAGLPAAPHAHENRSPLALGRRHS